MPETLGPLSTFAVLSIGLLFGLKHATEVDHVVAVSTIVSQHRNVWRSTLVGALWGAGHTAALLITGVFVLTLKIAIPERVSSWLEFCVALMIIGLGATALWRALRKRGDVHVHEHSHDGVSHVHVHFHEPQTQHDARRSHGFTDWVETGSDRRDAWSCRFRCAHAARLDAD
jgi:ABC-type nickel/cobalt efflux system permease component RcnA